MKIILFFSLLLAHYLPAEPINQPLQTVMADTRAERMADCFSNIQKLLNNRKKKELIAQGIPSKYIECLESSYPANSSIWWTDYPAKGFCYDRRKPFSTSPKSLFNLLLESDHKKRFHLEDFKLAQCNMRLTTLETIEDHFLLPILLPIAMQLIPQTWDDCVKNKMKEIKRTYIIELSLTSEIIPENISCSGNYGTNKGWKVTCSSTNSKISEIRTGFMPYPEICQGLPGAIDLSALSVPAGSGQR